MSQQQRRTVGFTGTPQSGTMRQGTQVPNRQQPVQPIPPQVPQVQRQPLITNGRFTIDASVYDIFQRLERALRLQRKEAKPQTQQAHIELFQVLDDFDTRCDQIQLYCVCISFCV